MGYLVSEEEFLSNNIFKYEERMNNQYSRFLDRTPTYVTYYNISNINSVVDNGFQNVEALLGDNSPLRFNKVENFPIYGIDQIVLDLTDDEEGLTTEYDGEAVILPNTVKPLPGDFFVINHLSIPVQFMVTDIKFDTIKSNNFYKISYTMKSLSETNEIEKQVSDKFKCIVDNIGTEEKCLIKEDEFYLLQDLITEYERLADTYKMYFYNKKYNSFTVSVNNFTFYDPYLSLFLRNNKIFSSKEEYKTIRPEVIGNIDKINIDYNRSMYRYLELHKPLPIQYYSLDCPVDFTSPFAYYGTQVVHIKFQGDIPYLHQQVFDIINGHSDRSTYVLQLISKFITNKLDSIYTLDIDTLKTVDIELVDRDNMVIFAMLLYVLKESYHKFIMNKK